MWVVDPPSKNSASWPIRVPDPPPSDLIGTFRRKNDQVRKNGLRLHIFYVAGLDRGGVRHTNELSGKYQLAAGLVLMLF